MNRDRQCLVAAGYLRDGKLRIVHQDDFKAALSRWKNCRVLIRLEEHLDPLSEVQRAYYFAGIVRSISEETGYTDRETHERLKEWCMPYWQPAVRGNGRIDGRKVIGASIADMNSRESSDYHDAIRLWSLDTLQGFQVPDPVQVGVIA